MGPQQPIIRFKWYAREKEMRAAAVRCKRDEFWEILEVKISLLGPVDLKSPRHENQEDLEFFPGLRSRQQIFWCMGVTFIRKLVKKSSPPVYVTKNREASSS